MNKKQYVRLSLVLLLPLLLLGLYLTEEDFLIPHHHYFLCDESETSVTCSSMNVSSKTMTAMTHSAGAVTLLGSARLDKGFHHPVMVTKTQTLYGTDNEINPPTGGVKKMLNLPLRGSSLEEEMLMSCRIYPMRESDRDWIYECLSQEPESFRFIDDRTNKKFRQAVEVLRNQTEQNKILALRNQILSVLLPLFGYLLLSLLIALLAKVSRFVIHGRQVNATARNGP